MKSCWNGKAVSGTAAPQRLSIEQIFTVKHVFYQESTACQLPSRKPMSIIGTLEFQIQSVSAPFRC